MRWCLIGVLAASCVALPTVSRAACLAAHAGLVMQGSPAFEAALQTKPARIVVGEPFVVYVRVCDADGKPIDRLTIDAAMPAHRHGMNYRTEISALGEGRYEARGFLFHMPGRWEITLSIYSGTAPKHLKLSLDVK
jgi:nitrogen fixation protein FixH